MKNLTVLALERIQDIDDLIRQTTPEVLRIKDCFRDEEFYGVKVSPQENGNLALLTFTEGKMWAYAVPREEIGIGSFGELLILSSQEKPTEISEHDKAYADNYKLLQQRGLI